MNGILIRKERAEDHKAVEELIREAFAKEEESDHREHLLVHDLRALDIFVPELSLVAVKDGRIIGHILMTPIRIVNDKTSYPSLALAPVSVAPTMQKEGIGGSLIRAAHTKARLMGHRSVILLGHEAYYRRFGYKRASSFGIRLPFNSPDENAMAIELVEGGLRGIHGKVEYPAPFHA
jgi:predicted N-acetyltransferase YhbS